MASAALAACFCGTGHAQVGALAGELQICEAASSPFNVSQSAADANGDYWVAYSCKTNCADWQQCRMAANAGGGGAKEGLAFVVDGMGGRFSFTTEQTGAKTLLLHTGTGGTSFMHSLSRQIENASDAKVVMVRWESGFSNWGWFTRTSAPATRVPNVTRRIASVIAWVHENLAGAGDFGTVGCSMGTQATLGAVYWHGVDSLVDYQLMVGGPGLWDINAGCGRRQYTSGYCDLDASQACSAHADCSSLSARSRCVVPGPIPFASLYESVVNHVHATQACDVSAADSTTPIHAPFDESGFGFTTGDWDFDHPIDFQMDLWGSDGDHRWAMGDAMRVFNSITSANGHPKRWNTTADSNHCAAIGDGTALRLVVEGMGLGQSDEDDDDGVGDITNPAELDAVRWDPGLRAAVERALGKPAGAPLTLEEMLTLESLTADAAGISSLQGLQAATRLEYLDLSDNALTDVAELARLSNLQTLLLGGNRLRDLSPLSGLNGLQALTLAGNGISNISALSGLSSLEQLWLDGNGLSDIAALAELESLTYLHLGDNRIADISPLAGLAELRRLWLPGNMVEEVSALSGLLRLTRLDLARNQIADVSPLAALPELSRLHLGWNRVADVSALVGHGGLANGGALGLRGNPLRTAALRRQIPALREAGATVVFGWPVPLFPSAADSEGRSGVVRVLNRSDMDGVVLVEAVDGAGRRFGPVRLALAAGAAVHFDSADLENGNAALGLAEGVGRPTRGSWRLLLWSVLDLEVLAYVRTPDGFLTAAHAELPRDGETLSAFLFNPASNRAQRSLLRVFNPGTAPAGMSVWGVDDAGHGRLAPGFAAPGGAPLVLTAWQLERSRGAAGAGLGNGAGKWRLRLGAPWPLSASSWLESPSGHVSNVSSPPVRTDAAGVLRLPLFPASSNVAGRTGFARVANLTAEEGWVDIEAVDDAGERAGPVRLRLAARATVHFNSKDLENGNAAKGLSAGIGVPTRGAWRLQLRSDLALAAAAYARHADGFVTSLHEVAPAADGAAQVAVFNGASDDGPRSLLRLANNGEEPATATITGVDDAGAAAEPVTITVPAGEALTLTAAQLERGAESLEGALGEGDGKWRLTVEFDNPLTVMSLMESPAGHLSNLSATARP